MKALAGDRRDRLRAMLADLKLPGALEAVDGILAQADSGAVTASEAIEELLSAQIVLRNNRRLQTAMRSSRLPAVKTLQQFDFSLRPTEPRHLDHDQPRDRGRRVGPPRLLRHACRTLDRVADRGVGCERTRTRRLHVLTHPAPGGRRDRLSRQPGRRRAERHERASTVLTSNKGFEEWGGVLDENGRSSHRPPPAPATSSTSAQQLPHESPPGPAASRESRQGAES